MASKATQAILLQDVEKLGRKGDVVHVAPGYMRNFLGPRKLAEAATDGGFTVDKRQVILNAPIKDLGIHPVTVRLHPEVDAGISVNVARSPEEAELQAAGKSIQELAAEAEAAAEFEISELFDDIGGAAQEE